MLASGGGTNLQAILDQLHAGPEEIEVVGVVSDKPEATALERAARAEVETAVFPATDYEDRAARDAALGDWIDQREVDLVVLAGYMQMLSPDFVERSLQSQIAFFPRHFVGFGVLRFNIARRLSPVVCLLSGRFLG